MPTRVFTFYKLRPDVVVDEFMEWSRTVDQPTCKRMPTCHRFEVFLVEKGVGDDVEYDVVEDIEVESWESWQETLDSEAFARVTEEWPRFAVADSLVSINAGRINPGPSTD